MIEQKSDNGFSRAHDSESGFSMIEMLIAAAVITVGLVAIVGMAAYVFRTNSVSNQLNILAAVAQDQVDRLRTAAWTMSTEDPTISVGGSLSSTTSTTQSYISTQTSPYRYTLDSGNPHHATMSNTPAGDLNISWQVRQGSTSDLRYVTIRVAQINAPPNLRDGFTVTTIIARN